MGRTQLKMLRAKIMVAGPKQSGKSSISDFLASHRDAPKDNYDPTAGVRIQEFEATVSGSSSNNDGTRIAVELWDMSGDFVKYQNTWPAVQADCDGCLFVAEAETLQSKSTEIEDKWFRELVLRSVPAGLGAYSALRAHHVFAPGQVGFCAHSTSAESPNQFPDCRLRKYNRDALRLCELAPDLVCDSTGAREYEGV